MSHKLNKVLALLFTAALLFGLAACQAAPAAPGAPEAAAPAGEQQVLRIWHYEPADNAMGMAWDDAMKDFQAQHPDVKVEFELKTFEQIVETGRMVLNSNDVPDVMEINKGNATAGLYAKEGLLTNLDEIAATKGWDQLLSPSIQTTARYNEQGIMALVHSMASRTTANMSWSTTIRTCSTRLGWPYRPRWRSSRLWRMRSWPRASRP